MKFLKKINKGLILTIIVLAVIIIYIINIEKQRKADEPSIKNICEEFIAFTDKYSVLPEDIQKLGEEPSKEELEKYTKEMKTEIEKLMISNKDAVNIQQKNLENKLLDNCKETSIRTKQTRKILKINEFKFEGNKVTVTFNGEVQINVKYFDGFEEQTYDKTFDTYNDSIVLQKVDGKWKVEYSNLQFEEEQSYNTMYLNY